MSTLTASRGHRLRLIATAVAVAVVALSFGCAAQTAVVTEAEANIEVVTQINASLFSLGNTLDRKIKESEQRQNNATDKRLGFGEWQHAKTPPPTLSERLEAQKHEALDDMKGAAIGYLAAAFGLYFTGSKGYNKLSDRRKVNGRSKEDTAKAAAKMTDEEIAAARILFNGGGRAS